MEHHDTPGDGNGRAPAPALAPAAVALAFTAGADNPWDDQAPTSAPGLVPVFAAPAFSAGDGAPGDGRNPAPALAPGTDGLAPAVGFPPPPPPVFSASGGSTPPGNQPKPEAGPSASHGSAASVAVYNAFDDMGLKDEILRGIYGHGFEKPSAIQKTAIVPMAQGRDTIAQAQSDMGKTAAFVIGILNCLDPNVRKVQAMILAPSRELAQQLLEVVKSVSTYMVDVTSPVLIGGKSVQEDIMFLRQAPPLVMVGTPGRVLDLINRRALGTSAIKTFCLDEADELLSRGFKEQIYVVFQYMPPESQVGLFLATMPQDVLDITEKFMREPARILVKAEEVTLEGIKQYYVAVEK